MEYFRDTQNQIYADLAYRLGKVAVQYEKAEVEERKFETTLYLTFLQNLLTNCNELIRAMKRNERKRRFGSALSENPGLWGLSEKLIKVNTFGDQNSTYETVINRIRNSLSHPTVIDVHAEFPASGYSTLDDGTGLISQVCFVNSPDVKTNRPKRYKSVADAERAKSNAANDDLPDDVLVEEIVNDPGKFGWYQNGAPFARVFRIDLPVKNLRQLMLELSNHLAQPIREQWDGESVVDLFGYKLAA